MTRSYTVREIDALRRAVSDHEIWGSYHGPGPGAGCSRSYREADLTKIVEERVRTYMTAGVTSADLLASEPDPWAALYVTDPAPAPSTPEAAP